LCSGTNYALNVPLKDGMTDETYAALFRPVLSKVMEVYQPEVIVFQSGEASLSTLDLKHTPRFSLQFMLPLRHSMPRRYHASGERTMTWVLPTVSVIAGYFGSVNLGSIVSKVQITPYISGMNPPLSSSHAVGIMRFSVQVICIWMARAGLYLNCKKQTL
jgi:hypothetical protein